MVNQHPQAYPNTKSTLQTLIQSYTRESIPYNSNPMDILINHINQENELLAQILHLIARWLSIVQPLKTQQEENLSQIFPWVQGTNQTFAIARLYISQMAQSNTKKRTHLLLKPQLSHIQEQLELPSTLTTLLENRLKEITNNGNSPHTFLELLFAPDWNTAGTYTSLQKLLGELENQERT